MKKIFTIISSFAIISTFVPGLARSGWAQAPPPPRALVATSNTEKDGFKITFPKAPIRTARQIDSAFGKTDLVQYQAAAPLGVYIAQFIDFPTPIVDKDDIALRLETMKTSAMSRMGARLISQTDLTFGDYPGQDLVLEDKTSTVFFRTIFARQRMFQLMYMSTVRLSGASQRLKTFHEGAKDKFFNSFVITNLPAPQLSAVELPSDFKTRLEGDTFYSDYFKFSMSVPSGWKQLSEEEMLMIGETTTQNVKLKSEAAEAAFRSSMSSTAFLLGLVREPSEKKPDSAAFLIGAERAPFPNFKPEAIAKTFGQHFLESDERMTKAISSAYFGGREFSWIEIEQAKAGTKQRLYVANIDGVAFEITFVYTNPTDLAMFLEKMKTIKFDSK